MCWCPLQFLRCSIDLYRGYVLYLRYLYLFTYTGVQPDLHIRWCSCRLTVTRRVPIVEQKLLTQTQHSSSPLVFSGLCVARSIVFWVVLCRSLFVLLSLSLWSLCCLSFLTDSERHNLQRKDIFVKVYQVKEDNIDLWIYSSPESEIFWFRHYFGKLLKF